MTTPTQQATIAPECRVCFCGQRLMPFAIKCPSRQDCHVENVQKAELERDKPEQKR